MHVLDYIHRSITPHASINSPPGSSALVHSVQAFCEWLAATALSTEIQSVGWLVPALQTIHILSIAIVMSAVAMVDLHVLGILSRSQPLAAVAHRFLPGIWWTLIVLLMSGSALIIGEPGRSLRNPAFIVKMSMLAAALVLTLFFQRGLRLDILFWEKSPGRRAGGRLLAVVSLVLWVGIVFAGRWIAYVDVNAV
jgi:hypothetical protein